MDEIDSYNGIIPQDIRNVNISLTSGQRLSIEDISYVKKPSYIMVASGYGVKNMDYTKELLAMTPQEAFVFNILMDNRDTPDPMKPYIRSNYSHIDNSILTKSEKKKVYEGYKRLRNKNLVVRLARGKYLINPRLIITHDSLYTTELAAYIEAVNKLKD